MRKFVPVLLAAVLTAGLAVSAGAADYTFKAGPEPDYYRSTDYEERYNTAYRYGGPNEIDYEIPAIKYGLSQEFLEHGQNDLYSGSQVQYGRWGVNEKASPTDGIDLGNTDSGLIEVPYRPGVSVQDLMQPDGSIAALSIARVGLSCKVFEGATDTSMAKGAGHYEFSSLFNGNVGLFGHNRGNYAAFRNLKDVRVGDTIKYQTKIGTKTYRVNFAGTISYDDYSPLNEMGDNRITLITCVANQPSLRLCVQAKEIK